MDHKHVVLDLYHNQLQQIPGAVGTSDEVPQRILTEFDPGDGVPVGVVDIVVRNLVSASRLMDLNIG